MFNQNNVAIKVYLIIICLTLSLNQTVAEQSGSMNYLTVSTVPPTIPSISTSPLVALAMPPATLPTFVAAVKMKSVQEPDLRQRAAHAVVPAGHSPQQTGPTPL